MRRDHSASKSRLFHAVHAHIEGRQEYYMGLRDRCRYWGESPHQLDVRCSPMSIWVKYKYAAKGGFFSRWLMRKLNKGTI
jgi:hypothetical protein